MLRFTTHYDGCENRTMMIPSETGAWVHVEDVQKIEKERDEARAEVERLRDIVAVNDQRLATLYDEKQKEIEKLRSLLSSAHEAIRCGFMDGKWATIVQTQKKLLPDEAVAEAKYAELVINLINKVLRGQKT